MNLAPIRFIAVHSAAGTSLAVDAWLSADEVTACRTSVELLKSLTQLHARRHDELEQALASARAAGHAQGRDEALRTVAPQLLRAWQDAAAQARIDLQTWREAAVALSQQIVQHIAHTLAPAEVVAALAGQAAEALAPDQAAVVHVHPDVAASVAQHLADAAPDAPLLEVRADATLQALDCRFDMPQGQWFVGLGAQLSNAARAMLQAAPHAQRQA